MPKTFYTERDIEELARRGVTSITVTDDVVLTEVAREKAERLGVALLRADTPPSAPIRPYIAAQTVSTPKPAPVPDKTDLREKVRQAVIARLGNEVDRNLLDTIITRVLDNVGVRG